MQGKGSGRAVKGQGKGSGKGSRGQGKGSGRAVKGPGKGSVPAGTLSPSSSAYDPASWPGAGSGMKARSEPASAGTRGQVVLPRHGQAPGRCGAVNRFPNLHPRPVFSEKSKIRILMPRVEMALSTLGIPTWS